MKVSVFKASDFYNEFSKEMEINTIEEVFDLLDESEKEAETEKGIFYGLIICRCGDDKHPCIEIYDDYIE